MYPQKGIVTLVKNIIFCQHQLKVIDDKSRIRSWIRFGSGSVSQRYGSEDLKVTDEKSKIRGRIRIRIRICQSKVRIRGSSSASGSVPKYCYNKNVFLLFFIIYFRYIYRTCDIGNIASVHLEHFCEKVYQYGFEKVREGKKVQKMLYEDIQRFFRSQSSRRIFISLNLKYADVLFCTHLCYIYTNSGQTEAYCTQL